jgi:kynurenine formamidase
MCATRFIDLSSPLENGANEPRPPEITYLDHKEFGARSAKSWGIPLEDLHDGVGGAAEQLNVSTHSGTHMDSPWHYGPTVAGKPSRKIDQIPVEWCYGDGVVLDLRHKNYEIKEGDIVLLWTGTGEKRDDPNYSELHPGMSIAGTEYLLDRGVRVIAIDAFGFDRPFNNQIPEFKAGKKESLMPCHHILGRQREYFQIEQIQNIGAIPRPHSFKLSCFPINIKDASGGWVRPVAIVED